MKLFLILAACATLGAGLELRENTLYRLDLTNSSEPVYGYYKSAVSKPSGTIYYFRMASPDPNATLPPGTYPSNEIAYADPVTDQEWEELKDEARAKAGNVRVETANGVQWVPAHEHDLAQRATQMAQEREQRSRQPEADAAVVAEEPATGEEPAPEPGPGPGFIALWGGHIAVAAGALVLIGVVVRFMILGGD